MQRANVAIVKCSSKAHYNKAHGNASYRANSSNIKKASKAPSLAYTKNQEVLFDVVDNNHVTILYGPAGSGKTRCAVDAGVKKLTSDKVSRLVITRPAVCVQEEHGFLPGNLEDKMKPWMMPIYDALDAHFDQYELEIMLRTRVIEISPLAYMRGRTFENAFIICDEAQNCTGTQLKMVMTRIGQNSKMIITGDPDQDDLSTNGGSNDIVLNGLNDLLYRIDRNGVPDGLGLHAFDKSDIKRNIVIPGILCLYK